MQVQRPRHAAPQARPQLRTTTPTRALWIILLSLGATLVIGAWLWMSRSHKVDRIVDHLEERDQESEAYRKSNHEAQIKAAEARRALWSDRVAAGKAVECKDCAGMGFKAMARKDGQVPIFHLRCAPCLGQGFIEIREPRAP